MNLADIVLGLALGAVLIIGLWRGLSGLVLVAAASLLSIVAAGVAAFLLGRSEAVSGEGLLLLVPVTFFVTLFVAGYVLRSFAGHLTRFMHRLPFATVDRLLGALLAGALGVVVLSLIVLGVLSVPFDNPVTRECESGVVTPYLLDSGARAVTLLARPLPFLTPLSERLNEVLDGLPHGAAYLQEV